MIFLDYLSNHSHRGKESFDTHVWILKILLEHSMKSRSDRDNFMLYIIAASFEKMRTRLTKRNSKLYLSCLQNQTAFAFKKLPSEVPNEGDRKVDKFVDAIPHLAQHINTKIPNLLHAANLPPPIEIYNERTYMEFHRLLCELLNSFGLSLKKLKDALSFKNNNPKWDLKEDIYDALSSVQVMGYYLWTMVRSSAIETHLQTIAEFLDVDSRKMWTPEPEPEEGAEDEEDEDFRALEPYSISKGKPLLPWESYRDWLRLMVHYFETSRVLTSHVNAWIYTPDTITITTLSPPLPDERMLDWTTLLKDGSLFLTDSIEMRKGFIDFLTTSYNEAQMPFAIPADFRKVINSAKALEQELESDPQNSLTRINNLLQTVRDCDPADSDSRETILEKILALKTSQPQDRPAKMQTILNMLHSLSKRASFYSSLKDGPLRKGERFHGKYHCEAYVASLLLLGLSDNDGLMEQTLNKLSAQEIHQMKALLAEIVASHVFMHHLNLC